MRLLSLLSFSSRSLFCDRSGFACKIREQNEKRGTLRFAEIQGGGP
jgi:hypothetical protein